MDHRAMSTPRIGPSRNRNIVLASACGIFAGLMLGAAYAAVPLYNWFCRSTGFGGTPRIATAAPAQVMQRKLKVRFDSNVAGGLPWQFEPEQNTIEVRIGEVVTVNYRIANQSARETLGMASYNVSPPTAGAYFTKLNCFCFNEQRLKPGEARELPVVFYVDPALMKDAEQDGLDTITLSYTMYPVRQRERADPEASVGSGPT
jgi:cytochrome c oxidase assembly protein subunit 11